MVTCALRRTVTGVASKVMAAPLVTPPSNKHTDYCVTPQMRAWHARTQHNGGGPHYEVATSHCRGYVAMRRARSRRGIPAMVPAARQHPLQTHAMALAVVAAATLSWVATHAVAAGAASAGGAHFGTPSVAGDDVVAREVVIDDDGAFTFSGVSSDSPGGDDGRDGASGADSGWLSTAFGAALIAGTGERAP